MVTSIISGFLIGVAGSAHCAGMCGPLCLALPLQNHSPGSRFIKLMFYQLGRITTYSLIGLLLGSIGSVFSFSGFSRSFSILMGIALAFGALSYYFWSHIPSPGFLKSFFFRVQSGISRLMRKGGRTSVVFAIGMLNGLLPCGLVYLALMYGISLSSPWHTLGYMAMFGLGTAPVMLASGLGYFKFRKFLSRYLRPAIPVMVGLMGLILLLRGLNLGIPFLSPFLPTLQGEAINCHP